MPLQMLRAAISRHTGQKEAPWPKDLPTASYGTVELNRSVGLIEAVARLFPGEGIASKQPKNMEDYDQVGLRLKCCECTFHAIPGH